MAWLDNLPPVIVTVVGGLVSGAIGFLAASIRGGKERRWTKEEAARAGKAEKARAAAIPCEIIVAEIGRKNQKGVYFNGSSVERILANVREAIYGLRDDDLIRRFEEAFGVLWNFAAAPNDTARGREAKNHLDPIVAGLRKMT